MRSATLVLVLLLAGCTVDDSWEPNDGEGDVGAVASHDPDLCPNDRGGPDPSRGGPGGKPIPAPRDCTQEATWEMCYACCDWNAKHSWGEACKRYKEPERAACWKRLESELRPACYKACERPGGPITTVAP
jgi:hypothetical protein